MCYGMRWNAQKTTGTDMGRSAWLERIVLVLGVCLMPVAPVNAQPGGRDTVVVLTRARVQSPYKVMFEVAATRIQLRRPTDFNVEVAFPSGGKGWHFMFAVPSWTGRDTVWTRIATFSGPNERTGSRGNPRGRVRVPGSRTGGALVTLWYPREFLTTKGASQPLPILPAEPVIRRSRSSGKSTLELTLPFVLANDDTVRLVMRQSP
jgi:hypothetical protein